MSQPRGSPTSSASPPRSRRAVNGRHRVRRPGPNDRVHRAGIHQRRTSPQGGGSVNANTCRSCGAALGRTVFDLGLVPLANEYRASERECETEQRFPLKVRLCEQCWLLQLEEAVPPSRLFSDYAYFSSYSDTWMSHAKQFVDSSRDRWQLDERSVGVVAGSRWQ